MFSLGMATLGVNKELFLKLAAYSEFSTSIIGFYTCGAVFLNNFFGRELLPLGKPLGLIKRGPVINAAPSLKAAAAKNIME
jgi:uncharacterized protein